MKYLGFHNKNNTDSVFKKFVKPIDNETGLVSGKYFSISEVKKSSIKLLANLQRKLNQVRKISKSQQRKVIKNLCPTGA